MKFGQITNFVLCAGSCRILPDAMQIFSESSCLWAHQYNLHSFNKTDFCSLPAFILLGSVSRLHYPHSQHLCAKFPFNSTPHESRCDLCHCYVCDSLAPCAYWGSGVSSASDHCHANDKEAYWQLEKKFRQSKNGPTPISRAHAAPMLPRLPQSSAQAHLVSSSFGRPRPNITMARTRFPSHLVSQQLVRTCNSSIQTTRGSTLASMRPVFKRCGYLNRDPSRHLLQAVSCGAKSNVNTSHTDAISTIGLSSQLPAFSQPSHTPMSLPGFQGCGIPSAVTSDNLYVSTSVNRTQNLRSLLFFSILVMHQTGIHRVTNNFSYAIKCVRLYCRKCPTTLKHDT